MDESLLSKYSKPKPKAPNSQRAEQINRAIEITGWDFKRLAGMTRHLTPEQIFLLNKESKGSPKLWNYWFKEKYKINNMQEQMKQKLRDFPAFRERSQRGIYLTKWALRDTKLLEKQSNGVMMTMNELSTFAIRYASLERIWRSVLATHPELRGSDYSEGEDLEKKKMKSLGYNVEN